MPTPRQDESRDDFIDRCIPVVIDDGTADSPDQAVAVCAAIWENDGKSLDNGKKCTYNYKKGTSFMHKEEKNLVLPFEFKAVGDPDDKGYVSFSGYAAAFNNVDLGKDIIEQGAFSETIKEGVTWPILLDHLSYMTETAGYNVSAVEDQFGLKITGQINTNVEAGRIVYHLSKQALELGKKIGLSIGYSIKARDYDEETGIRTLKQLKMYEYSFTNFPMNPKATLTELKSKQLEMIKGVVLEVLEGCGLVEKEGNKKAGPTDNDELTEEDNKELLNLSQRIKSITTR